MIKYLLVLFLIIPLTLAYIPTGSICRDSSDCPPYFRCNDSNCQELSCPNGNTVSTDLHSCIADVGVTHSIDYSIDNQNNHNTYIIVGVALFLILLLIVAKIARSKRKTEIIKAFKEGRLKI